LPTTVDQKEGDARPSNTSSFELGPAPRRIDFLTIFVVVSRSALLLEKSAAAGGPPAGLNTVEAYNPATNSWSTVAPMPTARRGPIQGPLPEDLSYFP
jgi:hypothetical protein